MNGIGFTGAAVDPHFIMQVVAGRAAGRAHAADLLAAGDVVAVVDEDRRHVAVAGGDAAAMVDLDEIAVAAAVPAGAKHGAVGGRIDRRAVGAGEVDPGVHGGAGVERIGADAKAAGEIDVGLDRLVRRNRDHAVLQLIELLPAVEQRLEGRVAGAFERTADAARAADAGRSDAEPLQLGGGDLVADVERLRDERRLLELLLLDAGERAVGGKAAALAAAAISCGSIFWPASAASISAWRCSIIRARASVAAGRLTTGAVCGPVIRRAVA